VNGELFLNMILPKELDDNFFNEL